MSSRSRVTKRKRYLKPIGNIGAPRRVPRRSYRSAYRRRGYINNRSGGLLGIEKKFIDTGINSQVQSPADWAIMDPLTLHQISPIAQGDGANERDGRKCTLVSLHVKGRVFSNTKIGSRVRVVFFIDTQTNGAQVHHSGTVFQPPTSLKETDSFRNLEWTQRFKVLYDKTFELNPSPYWDGAQAVTSAPVHTFEINKKLNIVQNYKDAGGGVESVTDNSIHCMAVADAEGVWLGYSSRVRFVG